jgi:RNA-directed DNA polymerase
MRSKMAARRKPGQVRTSKHACAVRGWGNYFRTGNAATKFRQIDSYVTRRLKRLLIKKRGRNLRAGQADQWTEQWFDDHGLYRLRGTIRYQAA